MQAGLSSLPLPSSLSLAVLISLFLLTILLLPTTPSFLSYLSNPSPPIRLPEPSPPTRLFPYLHLLQPCLEEVEGQGHRGRRPTGERTYRQRE
jgi:hypothetical protein